MYPEKKYIQLVHDVFDTLITNLKLDEYRATIEIFVCRSTDPEYRKLSDNLGNERGLTLVDPSGSARVYLLYDLQQGKLDALATLFHELLHIKLYPLTEMLLTKKHRLKAARREEKIVQDLESFFLETFKKFKRIKI